MSSGTIVHVQLVLLVSTVKRILMTVSQILVNSMSSVLTASTVLNVSALLEKLVSDAVLILIIVPATHV